MYSNYYDKEPVMMIGLGSYDKEVTLKSSLGRTFTVRIDGKKVVLNDSDDKNDQVYLIDNDDDENFYMEVPDIEIGKGFHWSRKENQRFKGGFLFRIIDNKLLLINMIPIELY